LNINIKIVFCKKITVEALEGSRNLIAFMDGPIVLAGLCEEEMVVGDITDPEEIFIKECGYIRNHRSNRGTHYRGLFQGKSVRFIPLHEVVNETYTIYFRRS
jgi:hypothetical protein